MARTTSAKKAHRASLRKLAHNRQQATGLDKLVRAYKKTDAPTADQQRQLQQAFDKAGKTGLLHPRTAARRKSRLLKPPGTRAAAPIKKTAAKRPRQTAKK